MKTPPCICLDVFIDAALGRLDRETWMVEYEHYVVDGHVASCHSRGIKPHSTIAKAAAARQHRILARILHDMMTVERA